MGVSETIQGQSPSMQKYLLGLKEDLGERLPDIEEANQLIVKLNKMFATAIGTEVAIDCGLEYKVEDGRMRGYSSTSGRDIGDRHSVGLKRQGRLRPFDVLDLTDELITRGTRISVHEPCLVYDSERPRVRGVGFNTSAYYVPIIRLGGVQEVGEPN